MKRKIILKSIKDPHIVEFVDGGIDREGVPTSQRQALERVLGKRVEVDGRKLPVFLIVDVGPWKLAPGEVMPSSEEFDRFEEDVINREYTEEQIKVWEKARERFIAKSIEQRRYAEQQAEQAQSADVARVISQMVRSVSQQTSGNAQTSSNTQAQGNTQVKGGARV